MKIQRVFFKTLKGQGIKFLLNTGVEKQRKEGIISLFKLFNNISKTKKI